MKYPEVKTEYKGVKLPAEMLVWNRNKDIAEKALVYAYFPELYHPIKAVNKDGDLFNFKFAEPIRKYGVELSINELGKKLIDALIEPIPTKAPEYIPLEWKERYLIKERWLKAKDGKSEVFITQVDNAEGFKANGMTAQHLFARFTFPNGSPVGKPVYYAQGVLKHIKK